MVTHYNWLFTIWWAKVPEEIIFQKHVFVNSSHGSQYQLLQLFLGNCN